MAKPIEQPPSPAAGKLPCYLYVAGQDYGTYAFIHLSSDQLDAHL
jgi:hypothetical protein